LRAIGTGASVIALTQKTESVRAGLRTGDAGRLPDRSGPLKKKEDGGRRPEAVAHVEAVGHRQRVLVVDDGIEPDGAPVLRSVPSPSPGCPWSK
jgi:hypothetical protein